MARRIDDFPPNVIRQLERRVNGKCSNPDHRVPTSGPTHDPSRSSNMGIAAHIKAASPEGPRFDPDMASAERKSIDNGIWLCSNCSIMVDRDERRYSVEVLRAWRREAERLADEEYGLVPISRKDYAALHGLAFGNLQRSKLSSAVADICRMDAAALEELDPRFSVDVSYSAGRTSYVFNPREPVKIACTVERGFESEFIGKLDGLLDHGWDLEIDAKAIRFEGSRLFEMDVASAGKLVLSTYARRKAIAKAWVQSPEGERLCDIDDVHGEIVGGAKSITFSGTAFGGVFSLEIGIAHDKPADCRCTSGIDLDRWDGRPVRTLPFFEKILRLYGAFRNGGIVKFSLEIEGEVLAVAEGLLLSDENGGIEIYRLLRHLRNVRAILASLGQDMPFSRRARISADDVGNAEEIYRYLYAYSGLNGQEMKVSNIQITLNPDATRESMDSIFSGACRAFSLAYECASPLDLLGMVIPKPRLLIAYSSAELRKANAGETWRAGGTYEVEVRLCRGCEVTVALIE